MKDDSAYKGDDYRYLMFDKQSVKEIEAWRQFQFDLEIANYAIRNWRMA